MGFFRQEYWSGLPFPSPGDIPSPGTEPVFLACVSLIAGRFFTVEPPRKPQIFTYLGQLIYFAFPRTPLLGKEKDDFEKA